VTTGIFGGTFDPPHVGHLIVAQDAALALGLDRILFIPAAQPPHKLDVVVSPAGLRARMLQLAVEGDDRFATDTLELERSGPSYTVDTIRELQARHPDTSWTLLIGVDQYREFGSWRGPDEIRRMARIGILNRGGESAAVSGGSSDVEVPVTRIDISSTLVRERVAEGLPVRYLVPPGVERLIHDEGLYRRNGLVAAG
jgi:nicotinate-nucleotide adenylyltransferase